MTIVLDDELLEGLERRWRAQSPALLDRLRPGLSDAEIDARSAPLGYPLPEEVRRWYRWHNGSHGRPVIFYRAFTTLDDDVVRAGEFETDDHHWPKGWLNVMDEIPHVVFDCRGALDAPVPVWHHDYGFEFPTRPVFDSIGDMITFWIELIDDGLAVWDAEGDLHYPRPLPDDVLARITGVPTD